MVEAVGEPPFDAERKEEPGYLDAYRAAQHELYREKVALLLEAIRAHSEDPRIPELENRRWALLAWNQRPEMVAEEVLADVDARLAETDDPAVVRHAGYWRARFGSVLAARDAGPGSDEQLESILAFTDHYPNDERCVGLLSELALAEGAAREGVETAWNRILRDHPDTHWGVFAEGMLRRLEAIGERFEIEFKAFRSGEAIRAADLAGLVLVVDFWSTTCMPCVAELPEMRRIYETYRERGVQFLGVSLDESEEAGGREALERFLDTYDVPWPIYYQGNGYESDFSRSWGVGSIPEVFLVDRQGRLVSTDARDDLEELILEVL